MAWFSEELESLLAVAVAELDDQGHVISANAGFQRLMGQWTGSGVGQLFHQPEFNELLKAPAADGLIYQGLLTFGEHNGKIHTLKASIWRSGRTLRLLAEYDVEALERLEDSLISLNRDYAAAQFNLAQLNQRLRQHSEKVMAISLSDPLTGVGNRRRMDEAMEIETARAHRTGAAFSAFLTDLDRFKPINDTYGHDAGDEVLIAFAQLLVQHTRATDIVTRFGGEEFVVLMPATEVQQAAEVAERIRCALAEMRMPSIPVHITASFGVAQLQHGENDHAFLRRIDEALYEAKGRGRNMVVTLAPETSA